MNHSTPSLLLASSSLRRKEILKNLKVNFLSFSPDIDESRTTKESPLEYVQRMSRTKAESALKKSEEIKISYILAADTIVFWENQIFGKAEDKSEAFKNLKFLSGKKHQVATGLTMIDENQKLIAHEVMISSVQFKELTDFQIENYLGTNEYKGKAGSYAIQGLGKDLIRSYQGSLTNIIGLPEEVLLPYLKILKLI